MTGLVVSAPDPVPSDDPTFDTDHMPMENIDAKDTIPASRDQDPAWLPIASDDDDDDDAGARERARKAWNFPPLDPIIQPMVLELWASALQSDWTVSDPRAFVMECGLGRMPPRLYDTFDQLYAEPPCVSEIGPGFEFAGGPPFVY
jgi:hypothetical protein